MGTVFFVINLMGTVYKGNNMPAQCTICGGEIGFVCLLDPKIKTTYSWSNLAGEKHFDPHA
jgi:hypothetical protein